MDYAKEKDLAASRAKVMKALGHPTRIFMVQLLSNEDSSVSDLTKAVGADVSTVSKHLSLLKQAGLLIDRKVGNKVLYSLICPCIMEFIHCIDDVIYQDAEKGLSCINVNRKKLL
ncbi:MAG: metalloregulator ArsR/SmtB family transcription factor [Spirochaetales bacterium]|uniref:Metalloregulator ArsR/SmtB family transcription factor n=1 Tax=Candidatus Thalassospirochaeta sargassi TaxID=3119039 RepID=A0AAJ1MI70_9SPIO|nr:metalloregulator ArsR/SmtB family transcription factor [Spirochaetales bacterium]